MLLRYTGISFISGAVNHGFFSGERSLWTAAIGMVLFVLGAVLEHRSTEHSPNPPQSSLLQTLALSSSSTWMRWVRSRRPCDQRFICCNALATSVTSAGPL